MGKRLTRRLHRLVRELKHQQARLKKFLSEPWYSKIGASGRDVPLDPHVLDAPRAHLVAALNMIRSGAFRDASNSLQQAYILLTSHRAWLYRYETGEVSFESRYQEL